MALDVDRTLDGTDACAAGDTPIRMLTGTPVPSDQVRNGPRTGVVGEGGNGDVHGDAAEVRWEVDSLAEGA